jgi:hypothetical protein
MSGKAIESVVHKQNMELKKTHAKLQKAKHSQIAGCHVGLLELGLT